MPISGDNPGDPNGSGEVPSDPNGSAPQSVHSPPELSRVAFRAPPFWKANPDLWFMQLESQFYTAGITSEDTKFHSVIAALDTEILTYVSDIVRHPPTVGKYDQLKKRIVGHFSQSETSRLRSLLQELQLGDKKPSQLLREMRHLAADKLGDDILKQLWMQRLSLNCQQILSVGIGDLEALAAIADKVTEVSGIEASVSVVQSTPPDILVTMQKQISALRESVERLSRDKVRGNDSERHRRRSNSHGRQRSPAAIRRHAMCWYHYRHGDRALNCNKPCSFRAAQNEQGNDQAHQ